MNKEINILFINDDIYKNDIFSCALNSLNINYYCRFAQNIHNAVKLISKALPDFIFIDMNKPSIRGFNCLKQIKKIKIIETVPVIMCSGSKEDAGYKKALKLGATSCLEKTSQISELINELRNIFHLSNLIYEKKSDLAESNLMINIFC